MYNDSPHVIMYPLQMVLPLISQQNSSTIGNNGSSRGQTPHYHHSHSNGSSSQLTTLSQILPDELLNHLANRLANVPKETKVSSASGPGPGQGCVSTCAGASAPPPLNMSVFPPLVKPQRPRPTSSNNSTPRKTWQSCTPAPGDASSSLVNNAEYPQLSEVVKSNMKNGCPNLVQNSKIGKKMNPGTSSGVEKVCTKPSGGNTEVGSANDTGGCVKRDCNAPAREKPPRCVQDSSSGGNSDCERMKTPMVTTQCKYNNKKTCNGQVVCNGNTSATVTKSGCNSVAVNDEVNTRVSDKKRSQSPLQANDMGRCAKCNPTGLFTGLKCICYVVTSKAQLDSLKTCSGNTWKASPLIGGAKIVRKKSTTPHRNSPDTPPPLNTLTSNSSVMKEDCTIVNSNVKNSRETQMCTDNGDVHRNNREDVQNAVNIIEGTVACSLSNVHISQPPSSNGSCDTNSNKEENNSKTKLVQLNCNSSQNVMQYEYNSCDGSEEKSARYSQYDDNQNRNANSEYAQESDGFHGKEGHHIDRKNEQNGNPRRSMTNFRNDMNQMNDINKSRKQVKYSVNRNNLNNVKSDLISVRNEIHSTNEEQRMNDDRSIVKSNAIEGSNDRDSPSSNSSPSDSSNSNKENYSKYNNNKNLNNHFYNNGYHYNNNGYNRHYGSLHSSRTNSYDDLKSSDRYYDSRDFRNSNNKLAENSNTWLSGRNNYHKSRSPINYNYNNNNNNNNNLGRGCQPQRLRFVENKNYNGNNYNTRQWVNNNNYNYNRGHNNYYNNYNNRNNNNNYRNNINNKNGYNGKQQVVGSLNHIDLNEVAPKSLPLETQDSTSGEKTSVVPDVNERDNPPTLTNSAGARGSTSSLSSCSNHSEGKSLKRHYTSSSTPTLNTNRSHNSQPLHRTHDRPQSPFGFPQHNFYDYVQNKRRNTSNGGNNMVPHPGLHWGTPANTPPPPLLNAAISQRRPGPHLNFYTPAMASLALGPNQGREQAPLLTLGPPPLVASFSGTMLTEVPYHVPDFESWDPLSKSIWTKFLTSQQTETRFRQKMDLTRTVEDYVLKTLQKTLRGLAFRLFVVGSTMSGFGTDTSDVDMCLGIRNREFDRNLAIGVLHTLESNMHYYEIFKKAELIHAKVPILKFQDRTYNLEVDLNCNNVVGVRNTHLLYCYAQMDWRIRPLVLSVKLWARAHNINDAKNMTISSYSFTLMVIHFLQCGTSPPVLPNLVTKYPGKFSSNSNIESIQIDEKLGPYQSRNEECLGALLTQFFHYYANFEYFEYAISVRRGTKIPIEECRNHKSQRNKFNQWKYLCIEEPFDLTNTARSVYNLEVFEHIRGVIRKCSALLDSTQDLNSIFEPLS